MEERSTPSRTRSRTWIIIAVVVALLFTCFVAALIGGAIGYALGRGATQAESVPPREYRVEPAPQMPVPGVPFGWALVVEVTEDSPAERAGLRVGDLITAVDGESLTDELTLGDVIQRYDPGDEVDLLVQRDGRERTITVTLGRNPGDGDAPWMGISYRQVPGGPRLRFEMPDMDERFPFSGGSQ